jgi:hypothetical protein
MALNISTDLTSFAFWALALERFETAVVVPGSSEKPTEPTETAIAKESSFEKVRFMVLPAMELEKGDVLRDLEITQKIELEEIQKQLLCRIASLCEA